MAFFKKINWRYSLGEILIVILGITIAFNLNSWGENRNSKKEKIKYLLNLKKNLEADTLSLDSNILLLQQRITDITTIRKYIRVPNLRMDTILPKFYNLSSSIAYRPRNIIYQTLINSGDFKLIDNFELKTLIQEHYLNNEEVLEIYNRQNILSEKYVGSFFMNELNFTEIYENKDYSFMESNFFSNMLGALFSTFNVKITASKEGKNSCKKLMDAIDNELKNQ